MDPYRAPPKAPPLRDGMRGVLFVTGGLAALIAVGAVGFAIFDRVRPPPVVKASAPPPLESAPILENPPPERIGYEVRADACEAPCWPHVTRVDTDGVVTASLAGDHIVARCPPFRMHTLSKSEMDALRTRVLATPYQRLDHYIDYGSAPHETTILDVDDETITLRHPATVAGRATLAVPAADLPIPADVQARYAIALHDAVEAAAQTPAWLAGCVASPLRELTPRRHGAVFMSSNDALSIDRVTLHALKVRARECADALDDGKHRVSLWLDFRIDAEGVTKDVSSSQMGGPLSPAARDCVVGAARAVGLMGTGARRDLHVEVIFAGD